MSTPRGSEARRGWLRGNVLWLSIVSLLNDAASEMIYPLLPLFLVSTLGAGPAILGVIESAADSVSSLLKLASGWLSDRVLRRKPLLVLGYGMASFARPLMALATSPWHVLFVRVADRIGKGVRTAPRDALLADSVHADVRGLAYGVHRAADHTGAVIGPLLGWALLLAFAHNYRTVFAVALVPGIITMLVLLAGVRERRPPAPTATPGREPATLAAPPEARTANDRVFTRYLVVLVIFTLGNASDAFLLLHAQQTLGVADSAVLLLWSLHHVSKVVWSVVGGSLADRFGPRPAIVAGWFVYALTYALFAVAQSAWQAWALFLLYGLFFGLTEAPEKALVARLAPVRQRGSAFGAYHATIGFATLPASLLFGLLWQRFGVATAFFTGATLALIASVLLFLWVRPTETSGGAAA